MIGILSTFLTWVSSDEIVMMRANSGSISPFPASTIPNLNLVGLCDTGWITSQESMFALAAFVFFAGSILALYSSLGGLVQIAGFYTYYHAFDSANAGVISGLPSGTGPKLALISIILVITGLLFPLYIWSKKKLTGILRRFISVAPEKDVQQALPLVLATAGSAIILLGQVVSTSSVYEKGVLSASLFILAGLILVGTAMVAMVLPWKSD